jgi:hypothetical protein
MQWSMARGAIAPAALACISAAAACGIGKSSDDGLRHSEEHLTAEQAEQCATRLAVAFTGKSASSSLLASTDPQSLADALVTAPEFIERFASFLNSRLNPGPRTADLEPSFYLARYILQNGKPWADLFTGPYDVDDNGNVRVTTGSATGVVANTGNGDQAITATPGLGYFRTRNWMFRYAGQELAGYRLTSAYRIVQNTTGIVLHAAVVQPGQDVSSGGRETNVVCASCHFQGAFALDKIARVLSKRVGTEHNFMTFSPPTEVPQVILDNRPISSDEELVRALVGSTHFKFNTCRHVFNFLYARDETTNDALVFDACVDALDRTGMIQQALLAVAKAPSFCQ